MQRKMFLKTLAAPALAAMALCAVTAHAQTPVEVPFYYPVAVGGPITKVIDGYAADFNTPIYAGTYQETIVKALTAHKSGKAPATSVLLSTDMFTLIDEDAIAPIDDFVKTDAARIPLCSPISSPRCCGLSNSTTTMPVIVHSGKSYCCNSKHSFWDSMILSIIILPTAPIYSDHSGRMNYSKDLWSFWNIIM